MRNVVRALTETPFGPVIRALLSQIAINPALGDPFRATVVQARRDEIAGVIARGVARGDLRPDADADARHRAPGRPGLLPPHVRRGDRRRSWPTRWSTPCCAASGRDRRPRRPATPPLAPPRSRPAGRSRAARPGRPGHRPAGAGGDRARRRGGRAPPLRPRGAAPGRCRSVPVDDVPRQRVGCVRARPVPGPAPGPVVDVAVPAAPGGHRLPRRVHHVLHVRGRARDAGKDGHLPMAVWYAVASLSVGLLAAWAGLGCGRRLAAEPGR